MNTTTPRPPSSPSAPDLERSALELALALGPGRRAPLPWPADRESWFRQTWRAERDDHPRWSAARRPSELLRRMTRLLERLEEVGARAVFLEASDYPPTLRQLGPGSAPAALFVRGALPSAERRAVAIVGSRAAYRADLERARELAATLAAAGHLIVSGGAIGIDTAAHEGALSCASGRASATAPPTLAILGSGLGKPYPPRNVPLFQRIVEAGGAVCSPFLPDEVGKRWHFPARNTLIAAMAELTVVVSAASRSGALDTARKAHRQGRRLAAVPLSPGCRALVDGGRARPVHRGADALALLGGEAPAPPALDDDSAALWSALEEQSSSVDELAAALGFSVARTAMIALKLELRGLLTQVGGLYRRLG